MTDAIDLLREASAASVEAARLRDRALDAHLSGDAVAARAYFRESREQFARALECQRAARASLEAQRAMWHDRLRSRETAPSDRATNVNSSPRDSSSA